MPSLVIKDVPELLHGRLRAEAARHHRSLTRQVIHLLETGCEQGNPFVTNAQSVNVSAPDSHPPAPEVRHAVSAEVQALFDAAFHDQDRSALLTRLMREAAEQELQRQRRRAAVAAIKRARAETVPQSVEAVEAALTELRR